jgi:hypothetical protein
MKHLSRAHHCLREPGGDTTYTRLSSEVARDCGVVALEFCDGRHDAVDPALLSRGHGVSLERLLNDFAQRPGSFERPVSPLSRRKHCPKNYHGIKSGITEIFPGWCWDCLMCSLAGSADSRRVLDSTFLAVDTRGLPEKPNGKLTYQAGDRQKLQGKDRNCRESVYTLWKSSVQSTKEKCG